MIAGTGHRPNKLGGYSPAARSRLREFARSFLSGGPCTHGISGMALGWDTALAHAFSDLGLPWTAAVPFEGQELRWPEPSRREYHALLRRASRVEVIAPAYSVRAMQQRNEWMVQHCDLVAALWDGTAGGTGNCVSFAKRVGRPTLNLWPAWLVYCPPRQ